MYGNYSRIIKICGITRQQDADELVKRHVDMAGFIFHPNSPRYIEPDAAGAIETGRIMRVGVFVNQSQEEVHETMVKAKLHLAQLSGDQDWDFCADLGRLNVMRVFWPERYETQAELQAELDKYMDVCRFFLFDAGHGGGGHGKAFHWEMLKGLPKRKTWLVAGGLGPDNLAMAIEACAPCGVDLNSGVEAKPGVKDMNKLDQVLALLR